MDRLWAAPPTDLYSRNKLLPPFWNRKKPEEPKGKGQKATETKPKITETIVSRILQDKDIPFNFEARLQKFFYLVAILPSIECGLIPSENLTVSGDGTAVHTHASSRGHHSKYAPVPASSDAFPDTAPRHYSDPDASWGWDSDLDKYYYGYTLFRFSCYNSQLHTDVPLLFRFTSAKRHDSVNALVAFHGLENHMPGLSIKICALTLLWIICPLIYCPKTEKSVLLLILTASVDAQRPFLTLSKSTKMEHLSVRKDIKWCPMAMTNPEAVLCGAVLLAKTILKNAKTAAPLQNMDVS